MTMRLMGGLAILALVATLIGYGRTDGVFAQDATPGTTTAVDATTLIVVERATTDSVIDLGEEGDSTGDLLAFGNMVYDEANENEVGTSQGSCVRTVPGEAWECTFSVILDDGHLSVEGPFYDGRSSLLAITGGTGAYSTARGEMQLEAIGETEFRFTFEFA
jgi:allene oxide cyclase